MCRFFSVPFYFNEMHVKKNTQSSRTTIRKTKLTAGPVKKTGKWKWRKRDGSGLTLCQQKNGKERGKRKGKTKAKLSTTSWTSSTWNKSQTRPCVGVGVVVGVRACTNTRDWTFYVFENKNNIAHTRLCQRQCMPTMCTPYCLVWIKSVSIVASCVDWFELKVYKKQQQKRQWCWWW